MIKTATDSNYAESVKGKKVIVDFYADWCGPCKMVTPILKELSEEYPDIDVITVDVDECPSIAQQYSIRNIPTVLFLDNGEIIDKKIGAGPKNQFEEKIKNLN